MTRLASLRAMQDPAAGRSPSEQIAAGKRADPTIAGSALPPEGTLTYVIPDD